MNVSVWSKHAGLCNVVMQAPEVFDSVERAYRSQRLPEVGNLLFAAWVVEPKRPPLGKWVLFLLWLVSHPQRGAAGPRVLLASGPCSLLCRTDRVRST